MKVRDAMIKHRECVGPNDSLATAENIIQAGKIPAVPIFDHSEVAGMLAEKDILSVPLRGRSPEKVKVREVMRPDQTVARENESQEVAEARMEDRKLVSLPVLDAKGKLRGVLAKQPKLGKSAVQTPYANGDEPRHIDQQSS